MDALVYEDTPLATYFESEAHSHEIQREPNPPQSPYAPQGLPTLVARIRNLQRKASSISPSSSEKILDRFRYTVVASQLLSDDNVLKPVIREHDLEETAITLRGAVATAGIPFFAAWALNWLRGRKGSLKSASWLEVGACFVLAVVFLILCAFITRRQYIRYIQKSAISRLSLLINGSHQFDAVSGGTIRFIQEVEVVARGYELSYPLPPISRIEQRQTIKRCRTLRSELVQSLTLLTNLYVESHNIVQTYVSDIDLQRYHDIYEVSLVEYSDAIQLANGVSEESQDSLKHLRFALRLYAVARKVFLCDLLALKAMFGWQRLSQWRAVFRRVRELAEETNLRQHLLSKCLKDEEIGKEIQERQSQRNSVQSLLEQQESTSESERIKAQVRRFDEVATGARALNAKIHVLKEELQGLTSSGTDDTVIITHLRTHYESIGADIRAMQLDWERGRNTMMFTTLDSTDRSSHASSGPRTPISPAFSHSNATVIDGGPADALRLLNGCDDISASSRSSDANPFDEEVFEAVANPRSKRMSSGMGMSREEKIVRLREERKKRATLQEQAETTTNMLRELQMVIKHRPSPNHGPPSTPTIRSPPPFRHVSVS